MALSRVKKTEVLKQYQHTTKDTGSCEVQVALLTTRINQLTGHLKNHEKDHHSRYGLIRMVERRKKLLVYLERENPKRYEVLIRKLDLRK